MLKKIGVTYRTAWSYWKSGKIDAYQLSNGLRRSHRRTEKLIKELSKQDTEKYQGIYVPEQQIKKICGRK